MVFLTPAVFGRIARPVSYTGSFHSSNSMLDQIWYRGAYGMRVNMHPTTLGSILYDRGDRKVRRRLTLLTPFVCIIA